MNYFLECMSKLHVFFQQLKLDDKKENSSDAINTGNMFASVTPNNSALNANRLPRGVHEELSSILKRIGSKEHNKDALSQLYDLRVSSFIIYYNVRNSSSSCQVVARTNDDRLHSTRLYKITNSFKRQCI